MSDHSSKEIWKDIPEYEGLYQVSNLGRVKSLARWVRTGRYMTWHQLPERMLKFGVQPDGYLLVQLCKDGEKITCLVHHLVLKGFVGPRPNGKQCRHFPDQNPTNNKLTNLSWGTPKKNVEDKKAKGTWGMKLKEDQVKQIRKLHSQGCSYQKLSILFRIDSSHVCRVVNRKVWKHI